RAQPHPLRLHPDRQAVRLAHVSLHGNQESDGDRGARSDHVQDFRRPDVLLPLARHQRGRRGVADRGRFLQTGVPRTADGVRGGSEEVAGSVAGRSNRVMLKIENLRARVAGKEILKGLSLEVKPGEVHAIMGPNGAGKSTLGNVLAGRSGYEVTQGGVTFDGGNLLELKPEARAAAGVFLAFQYPVEIPGVNNTYFLRAALNAQRKARGEAELDSVQFLKLVREKVKEMGMTPELLNRAVNEGFSGGEKKRNEVFQMAVLEPRLAILDETDSGLDIDALKQVAAGVNALRSPGRAFLVITHYQRLLDYIVPDFVHVLADGRIVESGGAQLARELEAHGYAWVRERTPAEAHAGA